jgi:hypothetical protein
MPIVVIVLCFFGVALFVQYGALVEMFQQLKQVRGYLDLVDATTPIDLGKIAGANPSAVGLPEALDKVDGALVLFLSNKCETCMVIAQSLAGGILPEKMWLVVVPILSDPTEFLDRYQLRGDRILVDHGISDRIGLDITPAAILIENGRLAEAHTVPSVRQLYASLPDNKIRARALSPRAAA